MIQISKFYKILTDLILICEAANIVHPALSKAKIYLGNSDNDLIYKILYFVRVTLNISQEQLDSISRDTPIVKARRLFFSLAKEYTSISTTKIGEMVSKDHSTVLHGLKKMKEFGETNDPEWQEYQQYKKLFLLQIEIKANNGIEETNEEKKDL